MPEQGHLLRIGERDKHGRVPLYEWLVKEARKAGLAGATVVPGIEGFDAHSRIHSAKILDLSVDLPIIIEIVDDLEKIEAFLPTVDEVVQEGLRFYRSRQTQTPPR